MKETAGEKPKRIQRKGWKVAGEIPPKPGREALESITRSVVEAIWMIHSLVGQQRFKRIARTRAWAHLEEDLRDAEISLGWRHPRPKLLEIANAG